MLTTFNMLTITSRDVRTVFVQVANGAYNGRRVASMRDFMRPVGSTSTVRWTATTLASGWLKIVKSISIALDARSVRSPSSSSPWTARPKARAVADVAKQVVARHRGPIRMVKHSIPHKAVQLTTRLAHQVLGAKRHRVVLIERGAEAIARAGSLQPLRSERHGLKPARWAGRVVILVALKADPHGAEQRVAVVDLTVRMSHEQREERAHMWVEEAVKILRVLDRLERHQRRDCVLAVLLGCQ
eukprot:6602777-Prymnesium_polylepis.1